MVWSLGIGDIHSKMFPGRDDARRGELYLSVLNRYKADHSKKCLQVGVSTLVNHKYSENFTSIDLYDQRSCIDVRCDLAKTPFNDGEFDFIVCNAILEHVKDPFACAAEMYRIANTGCEVWIEVPFIQPFHPTKKRYEDSDGFLAEHLNQSSDTYGDFDHGGDYWRFTPQGITLLMRPFKYRELMLIQDGGIAYYGVKE
jgi:SAM-dependent methyltransferase